LFIASIMASGQEAELDRTRKSVIVSSRSDPQRSDGHSYPRCTDAAGAGGKRT
jgi:hypothetical protein